MVFENNGVNQVYLLVKAKYWTRYFYISNASP